jgi:hypothetical protein
LASTAAAREPLVHAALHLPHHVTINIVVVVVVVVIIIIIIVAVVVVVIPPPAPLRPSK